MVCGHLQVDNCSFESSQIVIDHPASCHFRYCDFDSCSVTLSNVNSALFENCDFREHVVSVQGLPKESRNWAHEHLRDLIRSGSYLERASRAAGAPSHLSAAHVCSDIASTLATTHSFRTVTTHSSAFQLNKHDDGDSIGVASIDDASDDDDDTHDDVDQSSSDVTSSSKQNSIRSFSSLSQETCDSDVAVPSQHEAIEGEGSSAAVSNDLPSRPLSISSKTLLTTERLPTVAELERLDDQSSCSGSSRSSTSSSGSDSRISARWSSDGESVVESKLTTSFDVALQSDASLRAILEQATGPCFRRCRFQGDAGGLRLSQQAHCRVEGCQFKNLTFAVK